MRTVVLLLLATAGTLARAQSPCIAHSISQRWSAERHAPMPTFPSLRGDDEATIPVVFHVVWNTPAENVPGSVLQAMLTRLNTDLSAMNADLSTVRTAFQPVVGSPSVHFCLATTDPAGQPTTGIVRQQTSRTWFDPNTATDDMKTALHGSAAWDPTAYLNIWLCDIASGAPPGGVVEGYAYIATASTVGQWNDGVVLDAAIATQTASRTITHEVGHYLGLLHPWGDGGCGSDDLIPDTPVTDGPTFTCVDPTLVKCGELTQYENFMDHAPCRVFFTADQAARMATVLQGLRGGLLTSPGCAGGTGIASPVAMAPLSIRMASGSLQVEWTGPAQELQVIDPTGRLLFRSKPVGEQGSFPLRGHAAGLYWVRLVQEEATRTERFLMLP